MKTKKWNEVRSGSKIKLLKDSDLYGMNGQIRHLRAGYYYVVGFWVDLCGLSQEKNDVYNETSQVLIGNTELKKFEGII